MGVWVNFDWGGGFAPVIKKLSIIFSGLLHTSSLDIVFYSSEISVIKILGVRLYSFQNFYCGSGNYPKNGEKIFYHWGGPIFCFIQSSGIHGLPCFLLVL